MKPSRLAALALFALLAAGTVSAQPEGAPPPPAAAAPSDSTHSRPRRFHPWLELGGGWMSGPAFIKSHYQAGQGLAAGLEARPRARWALRTALDYQMLPADSKADAYFLSATVPGAVDTVHVDAQTTGWILAERTEVGVRAPGDLWLTAGGGGGYMSSGLSGVQTVAGSTVQVVTSGAVSNGWGWLWTAALRYDFTPDARVPLGLDVRTSELHRDHDAVRTWSVRLCYRVPEAIPGASRPHHGRGGRGRPE